MKRSVVLVSFILLFILFPLRVFAIDAPQQPQRPTIPTVPTTPDRPEFPPLEKIEFVHFPQRLVPTPKPTSVPLLIPGCPDPAGCNEYSLSRYKWSDPNGSDDQGLPYFINPALVPASVGTSTFENIVTESFGIWQQANSSGKLKYRNAGITTKASGAQDFQNTIAFRDISKQYRGALAVTTVWYRTDTKSLVEFDMTFNTAVPWRANVWPAGCTEYPIDTCSGDKAAYDVQNVAVHEIGHTVMLLDLGKAKQKELTMYGLARLGELKKRTLGLGDRTAVNVLYP